MRFDLYFDQQMDKSDIEPADIRRSYSSLAVTEISLDNILRKCGDFGRFQFIHYFFLNLFCISAGSAAYYYVFAAAEPDHRCRLPENIWSNDSQYNPINQTHKLYLKKYLHKNLSEHIWEKCSLLREINQSNIFVSCPNGWIYDRKIFGYTFTEEANLICDQKSKKSWLATVAQCAGFSLLIIGTLADKYGRKKIIVILTIFSFSMCLLTQMILQWIPLKIESKFSILLFNQFLSGLTLPIYTLAFILMLELTSIAHTNFAGNLAFIAYTFGEILIAFFAYMTFDWQKLKWANTIFMSFSLPYLYFMPESPLYLYAKKDYIHLEKTLKYIARINQRKEQDWYLSYQDLIHHQTHQLITDPNDQTHRKPYQLLFHQKFFIRLIVSALIGLTILLLYYQISFGLTTMNISPYLAILIGAIVEAISYMISSLLISTRLGRKGSFILMMSLTIICLTLIPTMQKSHSIASVSIAQISKFAISATTGITCIFVPELFPTTIRTTTNGFFIAFSRLGAIFAPIINTLISEDYFSYTFYFSAILAFIIVLCSLILPETKSKPMDHI